MAPLTNQRLTVRFLFLDLTMENGNSKVWTLVVLSLYWMAYCGATDPDAKDPSERAGRSWHQTRFGPQMLMQHQPSVSTGQPDTLKQQQQPPPTSDSNGPNRNFEEHEKGGAPAATELDLMARQFGYLNVHRFDPNYPPYHERNAYPRYPSPHTPRLGPGYRKDKYGEGYGYSCKQGDDCDEVKAANQLAERQPSPPQYSPHPYQHNPMTPFGNQFPNVAPYPGMPSYPNVDPYSMGYGSQFGAVPPGGFRDPHPQPPNPMHQSMIPRQYYNPRYLLKEEDDKPKESVPNPPQQDGKSKSK